MSRLILLPAADHVFYSEGDQEEDENDADDGELVPLAGLVGQKEEDEKDLTELLDLDVVLVVDVIGSKKYYPGPLCPSLIKQIKFIHF